MGNLSSCLRAAGEYLGADHREFILDQARGKRGDARNAAAIEAVDTLLARIEDQIAAAGGAVGEAAADETAPEERASTRRVDPLGFYSALEEEVRKAGPTKGTPTAWKDWLKGATKRGIKNDEVEWTGLAEWLDMPRVTKATHKIIPVKLSSKDTEPTGFGVVRKDDPDEESSDIFTTREEAEALFAPESITREEVLQFLESGGVRVQEVRLGSDGLRLDQRLDEINEYLRDTDWAAVDNSDNGVAFINSDADRSADFDSLPGEVRRALPRRIIERETTPESLTKYKNYTLPGGTNYREVLLTLPVPRPLTDVWRDMADKYGDSDPRTVAAKKAARAEAGVNAPKPYTSSHWDQPNILAHIRLKDRVDADGKRVLFVEEIQSDWAQQGKKQGFRVPAPDPREMLAMEERVREILRANDNLGFDFTSEAMDAIRTHADWADRWDVDGAQAQATIGRYRQMREGLVGKGSVPRAPFVQKTESWVALAVKRIINMAVAEGHERVAFVNGQQSADRYSLERHVESIRWWKTKDGLYNITAMKDGRDVTTQLKKTPEQLEDFIGKELVEKIVGGVGADQMVGTQNELLYGAGNVGLLSGLDLKAGGEGMKSFYDKIVPNVVKDVLRKVGGRGMKPVALQKDAQRMRRDEVLAELGKPETPGLSQPGFDITDEMRASARAGLPRFSTRRWDLEDSKPLPFGLGSKDAIIRYLQDKQVDLKRVVKAVTDQIGDLGDKWDAYLQEELYHERAAKKTKDFLDFELRPLLRAMQAAGVDLEGFETYLHNRHAEERNAQVAKINDQMPDGGSGIMTEDARAYLAGLEPSLRSKYEALAVKVDAINGATEALLVSSGLEKQETIDAWKGAYSKYVPLQREEFEEDSARGTGPGFSISGSASKRAMGSDKPVANILANIAMQRERTITRAEKNRVATALFGMAIQAPKKDFWTAFSPDRMRKEGKIVEELIQLGMAPPDAAAVAAEPTQRYVDPRSGRVVTRVNPLLRSDPNIVALRVNGEDRFVMFNHRDERANQVARAVKNLDADELGRVMGVMATISRYFASINTQWNPIFGVVNLTRDVQGAIVNLSSTPLADHKAAVLRQTGSALAGIYADIRAHRKGRVPQSQWAQLWEEFQNEGGPTGFRHLYENPKDRSEKIEAELKAITEGKLKKLGRATLDWLSDYNETLENAVRLAAYKVGKEQGLSNQRAASLAKNLTVNFNRKGQVATQAGALYAFFNASVQGTTRLAQTLAGPAGKKIIMGALLLGVLQAFALRGAGFDEEEPPEFVRDRNLVLPIGGKQYLTVPMPLGLHVLPGISRRTTEWLLAGGRDPGARLVGMLGLIADAFNPIGNAGISLQTVAPTPVDWLAALAENKDFSGRPIAKEDRSGLDPTPGYTRTRDAASAVSKTASYWLNLLTGGTDYKPGAFSPTPDQIDYFIGQLTGGLGRTVMGAATSVTATTTGEELPPYRIPLLGKFYGNAEGQAAEASKFYSNLKRINGHQAELKGLRKEGKGAEAQAYLRANPEARLALLADRLERDLSEAKRQKRMLVEKGASRDAVKLVETRITKIMTTLNRRVDALGEAPGGSGE